jgi:site-specific recombinase XerD
LDQQLRNQNNLIANALLLMRSTGIRIGECARLSADCLRCLGEDRWALHVPLGKLHTERWVPVDSDIRSIVARIQQIRVTLSPTAQASQFLLPQPRGDGALYHALRAGLAKAARHAGCSTHVTPHRLRHTTATHLLRAGVDINTIRAWLE